MDDLAKNLVALGQTVVKKARLSNAMGVPLVFVCVVTLPCVIAYAYNGFWPLVILAGLPVVYFIYAFDFLMKNNPNMLRTEEHEERMAQISAGLGRKGKEVPEATFEALPPVTAEAINANGQPRLTRRTKQ